MITSLDDPRAIAKALFESDAGSYPGTQGSTKKFRDEMRTLKPIL